MESVKKTENADTCSDGAEVLLEGSKSAKIGQTKGEDGSSQSRSREWTGRHPDSGTAAGRSRDLREVSAVLRRLHEPKEMRNVSFLPNISTNLTPYVSTNVARVLILQPAKIDFKGEYKQRATALKLVDPEKSLEMSRKTPSPKLLWTSSPPTAVRFFESKQRKPTTVPHEFFQGKKKETVRFPAIPTLCVFRPAKQELNAQRLDHANVMDLRVALRDIQSVQSSKRARHDYNRAKKDVNRFQLDGLKPSVRPVFRAALLSYFNTSTGARKAATQAVKAM
ncbi:uncharacterized protein LOC134195799 isoform X2 [Corticium candelabrum]|uniref:uncharacterized protein LOC134195799 isoform X2 n=1 Tax=Corticium candelabrum TaxID=121492 RepID=UPI002E2531D1|nr:uncharacterized protein LOC134195799 isoform X2 [Corticium candelabrum]